MLRHDIKAELAALATLASREATDKTKARLRRKLKTVYFNTEHSEIYAAMMEDAKKHGEIPSFRTLISDPGISKEAKTILKVGLTVKPLQDTEINKTIANLHKYYTNRVVYDMQELLANEAKRKQGPRIEAVKEFIAESSKALTSYENTNEVWQGKKLRKELRKTINTTAEDLAKNGNMIKTGWPTYDAATGGFARGNLVLLAATSGSGKSTVAMTLARNVVMVKQLSDRRCRTLIVSYELSFEELKQNLTSCVSNIPVDKIKSGTMTQKERNHALAVMEKLHEDSGAIDIITPVVPRTIHDIFDLIGGKSYDMIVIDYAGLVANDPGAKRDEREDQKYGKMAQLCKQKAKELNCVVVLLAQLNEKDKSVMYSQQFRHNCDILFKWEVTNEDKLRGWFRVEMNKQRRARTEFELYLSTEFERQQCNDCTQHALQEIAEERNEKNPVKKALNTTALGDD